MLVCLNRRVPCRRPVVVRYVRMRDDGISVKMVVEVVADGEIDPLRLVDHACTFRAALHDLELVGWTNAASEQELGGAESAGGDDNSAGDRSQRNGTDVPAVVGCNNVERGGVPAVAVDALDAGVEPHVEVVPTIGGD